MCAVALNACAVMLFMVCVTEIMRNHSLLTPISSNANRFLLDLWVSATLLLPLNPSVGMQLSSLPVTGRNHQSAEYWEVTIAPDTLLGGDNRSGRFKM